MEKSCNDAVLNRLQEQNKKKKKTNNNLNMCSE